MSEISKFPYKELGDWLKGMRQKKKQTVAEVSGAVEIDSAALAEMEKGSKRPTEDILLLFISYFGVKEEDAVRIWELAGYEKTDANDTEEHVQPVLVMPMDARIVYTDMASINGNKYGLTINFMQADGIGNKPLAVARVGMSREHAEKLLVILQDSLKYGQQKMLPAPDNESEDLNKQDS